MFRKLLLPVIAATVLFAASAWAETYAVDRGHSNVSFQIRHLLTKVSGRFGDFHGAINVDSAKPEASSVEFVIRTESIDTNESDRDKDLRSANFFDVAKYPEITFHSKAVTPAGKDHYNVGGTLSMHGVSKEIVLPVTYLGEIKDPWGGTRAGFETSITLNRKDFGINWNKALDNGGTVVGDDVAVSISIEAPKQKPAAK